MFDETVFTIPQIFDLKADFLKGFFARIEKLQYYARNDIHVVIPKPRIAKPISSLIDFMNSKATAANHFTLVKQIPYGGYVWDTKINCKTKGLFEYKFDKFTTIESILID
mmetsp:Transcript_12910/g.14802  ORF Transcript_12910/g.14802 Transcript_12910/m.14802 type:complete len:110 (-) Transcript_12910:42-371(-)